jgi:2-polyprenyl-3-methyl-5-hydroxy-6-metoxy-1,4-benzoquinol methylase
MSLPESDLLEKIRQQFDSSPYPRTALEASPKHFPHLLYIHNLATPYYLRNQKIIDTQDKVILDAGCGTGYKSLVLAEANPGAKIVGVDISAESIKLAQQRLKYHQFDNVEFHVLPIENLTELGYKFDYINCDEILYLLPDITVALQAIKVVLQPEGIIRGNLHSLYQRFNYFRAQKVFTMMGLRDETPGELEADLVIETMKALQDNVQLKVATWKSRYEEDSSKEGVIMNFLLQNDQGYTITDLFTALRVTDLEFISMVNWRQWNLMSLFKEPDNLPTFLGMGLLETSVEEQLQLFELLQPIHRLLDFWCGHPQQGKPFVPVSEWTDSDWLGVKVYLHPQLNTPQFQTDLITCVRNTIPFTLDNNSPQSGVSLEIDSSMASCLIPLLEQPQLIISLVERWKLVRPVDSVTLQPTNELEGLQIVKQLFSTLESCGYVMLERQA